MMNEPSNAVEPSSQNQWFQPPIEFYQPGRRLTLTLDVNSVNIEVLIIKAFTPFTWSVALLVEFESQELVTPPLPFRFVVKLADRRVQSDKTLNWTTDTEQDYQSNLLSHISKFGLDDESYQFRWLERDERLPWMSYFEIWQDHQTLHTKERSAYAHLSEAQALGLVPRFFGAATLSMMDSAPHPSLTHINALLLEYIPGRLMSSLRPGTTITVEEAEVVSQRIIQLGRSLRRYGVTHNDIHTNNIILRSPDNSPVLIDWGKSNVRYAKLSQRERWEAVGSRQDFDFDIRLILAVPERTSNEPLTPTSFGDGVWHRHETPLADEVQLDLAKERGFHFVNYRIQALSPEARLLFYDEDPTVDIISGLRWRVKDGVKTKVLDDPFPEIE